MPCLEENQHFQSQRQSINYKESKDKIWLNENYDQSQILDENSSIYEKKFTFNRKFFPNHHKHWNLN